MNGRLYDSKLGRFLSPDPFLQDPSNTQNFNRYSYCLNNPFAYTDPSGYTVQPSLGIGWGQNTVGSPVDNNYGWESNYDQSFKYFYNWLNPYYSGSGGSGGGNSVINNTTYNNFQIFITTSSFSIAGFDFYHDTYSGILKYYNNNAIGSVAYTPDPIVVNFNLLFFERNSGSELIFDKNAHYLYPTYNKGTPWISIAENEIGVKEIYGIQNNPQIIKYHSTTGQFKDDETAWCSSFVNWCLIQANIKGTNNAGAKSWLKWGLKLDNYKYGSITVVHNEKGYHVGFAVEKTSDYVKLLGGNQGNPRQGQVKYSKFYFNKYSVTYIYPKFN